MTDQKKIQNLDWDSFGFAVNPSRSLYIEETKEGEEWPEGELRPYGNISISPAAGVLNYGQGVFEGIKAFRSKKGRIVFFRLEENAKRFYSSAERICIPPVPVDKFVAAVKKIVLDNEDFVPPTGRGALYVRPLLLGTGPILGVAPTSSYTFLIFVSPVGPYFKGGIKPLNLRVTKNFHRAAPKGIGNVKAIGNYSASLYPQRLAKKAGFNEVIYLNAGNEELVEEVGSANVFALTGNVLKTARLAGSILPGITRNSVIHIAREKLGLEVQETDLTLKEVLAADEVFCTGTAVVVCPIGRISTDDSDHVINNDKMGKVTQELRTILTGIQNEELEDTFGWVNPLE